MIKQRFVMRIAQTVLLLVIGSWLLSKDVSAADWCDDFWDGCWSTCYDAECGSGTPPSGCGMCCDGGSCGPYSGCYDPQNPSDPRNCVSSSSFCYGEGQSQCACSACITPPAS
jgi:hypothetical protein